MHRPREEELVWERGELEKADRDLLEGAERVDAQRQAVARLSAQGHDTRQATALLATLEQVLDAWRMHRKAIVDRIAVLEGRKP